MKHTQERLLRVVHAAQQHALVAHVAEAHLQQLLRRAPEERGHLVGVVHVRCASPARRRARTPCAPDGRGPAAPCLAGIAAGWPISPSRRAGIADVRHVEEGGENCSSCSMADWPTSPPETDDVAHEGVVRNTQHLRIPILWAPARTEPFCTCGTECPPGHARACPQYCGSGGASLADLGGVAVREPSLPHVRSWTNRARRAGGWASRLRRSPNAAACTAARVGPQVALVEGVDHVAAYEQRHVGALCAGPDRCSRPGRRAAGHPGPPSARRGSDGVLALPEGPLQSARPTPRYPGSASSRARRRHAGTGYWNGCSRCPGPSGFLFDVGRPTPASVPTVRGRPGQGGLGRPQIDCELCSDPARFVPRLRLPSFLIAAALLGYVWMDACRRCSSGSRSSSSACWCTSSATRGRARFRGRPEIRLGGSRGHFSGPSERPPRGSSRPVRGRSGGRPAVASPPGARPRLPPDPSSPAAAVPGDFPVHQRVLGDPEPPPFLPLGGGHVLQALIEARRKPSAAAASWVRRRRGRHRGGRLARLRTAVHRHLVRNVRLQNVTRARLAAQESSAARRGPAQSSDAEREDVDRELARGPRGAPFFGRWTPRWRRQPSSRTDRSVPAGGRAGIPRRSRAGARRQPGGGPPRRAQLHALQSTDAAVCRRATACREPDGA